MLSNIMAVRWLKLLLVVLIFFGIYKYRVSLVDATAYASSLRVELVYAAIFVGVSLLASGLRGKHIINKLGGFMSIGDAFKLACVSASSVFSVIRAGSGISLYYLKRKGFLLSHVVTYYLGDRFFSTVVFLALGALVLGEFSWILALVLFAAMAATIVGIKFTSRLPNFWVFGMIKDFSEDLKKLTNPGSAVWLSFLALLNVVMDALAISVLTGSSLNTSVVAVVIGMMLILVSPTPAGLGLYEPAVSAHLIAQGVASSAAIGGVLAFRLLSLWVPSFVGLYVLHKEL
jgi:uncharacterized membrane protein YbhN (UPF0104 family)